MTEAQRSGEGPEEHRGPTDLMEAMGGPQGIADSSLPALAFVIAYTFNGNELAMAAWIAVGVGAVVALVRILRTRAAQFALAGFAGVALAAFVADRTGKAEDFFLPGLLRTSVRPRLPRLDRGRVAAARSHPRDR